MFIRENLINLNGEFFIAESTIFVLIITLNFSIPFLIRKLFSWNYAGSKKILPSHYLEKLIQVSRLMIWAIGVIYMLKALFDQLGMTNYFFAIFPQVRNLIIILFLAWISFTLKKIAESYWIKRCKEANKSPHVPAVDLFFKLVTLFIIFLAAVGILQNFGVNMTVFLASGGILGLFIGISSKDIVENYFGGLMLYFTNSFKVGESITTSDKSISGEVEEIGCYVSIIRGSNKKPYYVPNKIFLSKTIINDSREKK